MMLVADHITVTAGPDHGRSFALDEELVHIGRGSDNQVVLSDPGLAEHQASLVRKNGRYAIFAPAEGSVRVNGSAIPAERWVWLPEAATIRLGEETSLQLSRTANGEPPQDDDAPGAESETVEAATPTPRAGRSPGKSDRKRGRARERGKRPHVARFISDRTAEPLVKLGEDGKLPALELAELSEERPREKRNTSQSNPLLLYAVLGCSFLMSLGLLLISPESSGPHDASARAEARDVVRQFLGDDEQSLEPYQALLRAALIDHSQGDYRSERRKYRQVLRMLNSADVRDPANHNGLTGPQTGRGRAGDDELRTALQTLLAE